MSSIIPILISSGVFLLSLCIYLLLQNSVSRKPASKTKENFKKLKQEAALLSKSVMVLRGLSAKYFITLSENGFDELSKIDSALTLALEYCQDLLQKRREKEAAEIINYLYISRGRKIAPSALLKGIGQQSSFLEDWGMKSKTLLDTLSESIELSSENFKQISRSDRRQRKNTVLMLNEARNAIASI